MWFTALSPADAAPWLPAFPVAVLDGNRAVLRLLRHNPFPHAPPTFVRVRLYRYRFTTWRQLRATGACWDRTLVGGCIPPVTKAPKKVETGIY